MYHRKVKSTVGKHAEENEGSLLGTALIEINLRTTFLPMRRCERNG